MNSNQIGDTTNLILTKKRPSQIDLDTHKQVEKKIFTESKILGESEIILLPNKNDKE